MIQERDNNGNTPLVSYTRGSDLSGTLEGAGGVGGLLARSHGYSSGSWTTNNFYHADGGGNISYMVNTNQAMVATYRYDPYGNTISSSGTLASVNLYRFSSKEVDPNYTDSGLYYYGYRFYDPNLQRWLNRDPIGEWGGINLFQFLFNDALNFADLFGLSPKDVEKIINCFREKISDMTELGQRERNPIYNNFLCTFGAGTYGCWDQEIAMTDWLDKQKYEDYWTFRPQSNIGHHWGLAASSNPYDPTIVYDPMWDKIKIIPPVINVYPIKRNAPPPFPTR